MKTEVFIEISPSGDTKVSVKGVKGESCQSLTKEFEAALGKTTSDSKTKEYYLHEKGNVVSNRS